jgi:predicted permease
VSDWRSVPRSLARRPAYTLTAVLATAVGVGAAAAVFSVVDGVLLRRLDYEEPDRIVTVWAVTPQGNAHGSPSYPDFVDWRGGTTSLSSVAFVQGASLTHLDPVRGAARLTTAFATPDFVDAVRPRVHLGSLAPLAADAMGEPVIALKYATWQSRFGADSSVVGRSEPFSDGSYRVVAVLGPGVDYPLWADAYARLTPERIEAQGLDTRGYRLDTRVVARLTRGASLDRARQELSAMAGRLAERYPDTNRQWGAAARTLREELVGDVRTSLLVLLAGVMGLLVIACANVAGLILTRALDRGRELGIRVALGASSRRASALLMGESVVIAVAGGLLGLLLAWWGVHAFLSLGVPGLPRTREIGVDGRIVAFAVLVSLLSGVLAGALPALLAARHAPRALLGRGTPSRASERLRWVLVSGQIAVTVALVAATMLLGRSYWTLQHVDRGFDPAGLVTLRLNLPSDYQGHPELRRALYDRILGEVRARPGVARATLVNHLPLTGTGVVTPLVTDQPLDPDVAPRAWLRTAGADFFEVLGIPVVAGRAFRTSDHDRWSGAMLVSQVLARQLWGDADPLGRRLTVFRQVSSDPDYGRPLEGRVVGVVGNTRTALRAEGPTAAVYLPLSVHPWTSAYLAVRPRTGASVFEDIRRAVGDVEPRIPVTDIVRYEDMARTSVGRDRFLTTLSVVFSALALFLALVGTYGILSYHVRRRARELAIQVALGAGRAHLVGVVLRQAAAVVGVGILLGGVGALLLTRFIASVLYQVSPLDPLALGGAALAMVLMALAGSWIPARRAARADPMAVLRE